MQSDRTASANGRLQAKRRRHAVVTTALDRRLTRLRALVERIERLPASARREWMLQEARARMVDVETGVEPRPMRTLYEEPPATPREPPASRASDGRAVKRPGAKPARVAASRARPQPEGSTRELPRPVPEPVTPLAGRPDPRTAMPRDDDILWLEDQPDDAVTDQGERSAGLTPWRRGLRG